MGWVHLVQWIIRLYSVSDVLLLSAKCAIITLSKSLNDAA